MCQLPVARVPRFALAVCVSSLAAGCAKDDPVPLGSGTSDTDGGAVTTMVWSGQTDLSGTVEIAATEQVVVDAGAVVQLAAGTKILVLGALTVNGTAEAPVTFTAPDGWYGVDLRGTFTATYVDVAGRGGAIAVAAGASLAWTDSSLDLENDGGSPDCITVGGGDVSLDHVHVRGCHCPMHINRAGAIDVEATLFDGAAVPVMIAQAGARYHGTVFDGTGPGIQDVGGGIAANVAGNYWGGGPPSVDTSNTSQFTGLDDWLDALPTDVGPR